jgi:ABC-type transport system substrate-binding protein
MVNEVLTLARNVADCRSSWRKAPYLGKSNVFGWPDIPQVEAEVSAWYEAATLDEEKAIARRLNKAALDNAIYVPLGAHLAHRAWRSNVTGIAQGPCPSSGVSAKTFDVGFGSHFETKSNALLPVYWSGPPT